MTPPNYPFPLGLRDDKKNQHLFLLNQASSSSLAPSSHTFFETAQEQAGYYHMELQPPEEAKILVSQAAGSWDHTTVANKVDSQLKLSIWKKEERDENQSENSSVKWMSSKMRLMKKMNADAADSPDNCMQRLEERKQLSSSFLETDNSCNNNSYSNNYSNQIRVCADCNTTKTPLWRSGPGGPKSLCNACGIRQRKARQAMAAAAAAANGTILAAADTSSKKNKVQHKDKTRRNNHCLPFKKRCKFITNPSRGKKNLCFADLTIILSKNSAFQRVLPQDEKEAAILLMALSYGLVHG